MHHFFEAIQNKAGDALPGYLVKVLDSATGDLVPIYSDNSGTPISTESGIDDTAIVDDSGNASFYIEQGTYDLAIYSPSGATQILRVSDYPMGLSTITLATGSHVATRALLASIASPVALQAASLTESGREGAFAFDDSDLSAEVTIDTQQGIYIAPSSDTTGASGAWVRQLPDGVPNVLHFGVAGNGTTDDRTALQTAINNVSSLGYRRVRVPGLTYNIGSTLTITASNISIDAKGAKLTTALASSAALLAISGNSVSIDGIQLYLSDTGGSVYNLNIAGTDFTLTNSTLTGATIAAAGGIHAFVRNGADRCTFLNVSLTNRNGVQVEGNDFLWDGGRCESGGGDDAIAVKANAGDTKNGRVCNVHFKNHVSFLSIGTQIGTQGANDSTYSKGVYNWTMTNCTGENCASIVLLKCGTSQTTDYRDGTIDGIEVSNCSLYDPSGSKGQTLIWITAARGGRIRNCRFNNIQGRYRCANQLQTNAAITINPYDYTGGTAATRIENIFFNGISVLDNYNGAANGGSAPGYPIDFAVDIENTTGSGGTTPVIGRVEFNKLYVNGCKKNAVFVGTGLTGPFEFDMVAENFTNDATASSSARGAFNVLSPVKVKWLEATPSSNAPAGSRAVVADGATSLSTAVIGAQIDRPFPTVAAGSTSGGLLLVADRDMWISKVRLTNGAPITNSDTNYRTINIRNLSTGATLKSVTTQATGGITVSAFTPVSLNGTTQFTGNNAYVPKGTILYWTDSVTGTGAALTTPMITVDFVSYGAP